MPLHRAQHLSQLTSSFVCFRLPTLTPLITFLDFSKASIHHYNPSSHFNMPFRDKMKRAFGRPSNEESDLTQVCSTSSRKEKKQKREYADNVYKPGEIMPKPKYRAAYNKEHQDKLSAFSFGDAWKRRKSDQSQYSPRGSRLPSVVGSLRRMSLATGSRSRKQSIATERVDENIDRDDDVSNGE